MVLYLDDDSADHDLMAWLRKKGRTVFLPAEVGMAGKSDPQHLLHAIQQQRVLLTHSGADYEDLHRLVVGCGGRHYGILIVRSDNDRSRDMKPKHIVAAIDRLEKSELSLENQLIDLNHWR